MCIICCMSNYSEQACSQKQTYLSPKWTTEEAGGEVEKHFRMSVGAGNCCGKRQEDGVKMVGSELASHWISLQIGLTSYGQENVLNRESMSVASEFCPISLKVPYKERVRHITCLESV